MILNGTYYKSHQQMHIVHYLQNRFFCYTTALSADFIVNIVLPFERKECLNQQAKNEQNFKNLKLKDKI